MATAHSEADRSWEQTPTSISDQRRTLKPRRYVSLVLTAAARPVLRKIATTDAVVSAAAIPGL